LRARGSSGRSVADHRQICGANVDLVEKRPIAREIGGFRTDREVGGAAGRASALSVAITPVRTRPAAGRISVTLSVSPPDDAVTICEMSATVGRDTLPRSIVPGNTRNPARLTPPHR
jgi:hypothetical protein